MRVALTWPATPNLLHGWCLDSSAVDGMDYRNRDTLMFVLCNV